ncbi:MAG: pantetheine-phosphate adenylyltransferase [Legionellaceae bacterium]|nr:pantetheine-phosphate adenylyltransferase [Legionellaceae bacterium]
MSTTAVYPGTFDPITNGHLDIICRAARLFPKLIIAVAASTPKKTLFSLETRLQCVRDAVPKTLSHVSIMDFNTLLVDFAKTQQAHVLIRGIRNTKDFEYEFEMAGFNRKLCDTIETLFLMPSEAHLFLSSSFIREIIALNGDISPFVPKAILKHIHP